MKKLVPIILSIAMIFSLCSCGGNSTANETDESQAQEQTDASAQPDEEAPTNDNEPTEEETPIQEPDLWDIYNYIDDFNQPTEDRYISNTTALVGTFSNSATTDSLLYAYLAVDADKVGIVLYEYGKYQVKNNSSTYADTYNITMRTADGTDHKMTGTLYCGQSVITVDDAYYDEIISALSGESNQTTAFAIVDAKYTTTKYLISVVSGNFVEKYQEVCQ